jgi:hypothetical protein
MLSATTRVCGPWRRTVHLRITRANSERCEFASGNCYPQPADMSDQNSFRLGSESEKRSLDISSLTGTPRFYKSEIHDSNRQSNAGTNTSNLTSRQIVKIGRYSQDSDVHQTMMVSVRGPRQTARIQAATLNPAHSVLRSAARSKIRGLHSIEYRQSVR